MATLAQLYEDNLHPGAKRLWGLAKDAGLQVSFPAGEKWLKSQERHQEYKQNAMDKPKNWFKITDVPNSFAVDSNIYSGRALGRSYGVYMGIREDLCGFYRKLGSAFSKSLGRPFSF